MNEWEKSRQGYLYDPNDSEILSKRKKCADLCYELNQCRPSDVGQISRLLRTIIGSLADDFEITLPFRCDYGFNITMGKNFYSNTNLVILDAAPVVFGSNVLIGPNCVFTTATHPLDRVQRNKGLEIAKSITVGHSVWFGANVTVLPGVTIGNNVIIGAGSVVTKSIPDGVIAFGTPCRVIRMITEADRCRYSEAEDPNIC